VSLTEALRAGDPDVFGLLYDEHGAGMYAYCRRMAGDEAADALRDAFVAAARHPDTAPSSDETLPTWLYALARAECLRRGALVRTVPAAPLAAPFERAVARLRPEHREALALADALPVEDLALVIGVARDTAELLVRMARRRLEQAVITVLEAGTDADEDLLTALAKGRLHALVSRRAAEPPASLRQQVVAACAAAERTAASALLSDADGLPIRLDGLFGPADAMTRPQPRIADPAPTRHRRKPRRRNALVIEAVTLAACAAAVIGAILIWPAGPDQGASHVGDHSRLVRQGTPTNRPASSPGGTTPLGTGSSPVGGASTAPKTGVTSRPASATPAQSSVTASRPPASPSSPAPSATPMPEPTTSAPLIPTPPVAASPFPAPTTGAPSTTPAPKNTGPNKPER
jgi:DNA-directed RNA polymerase specialized sigma24 family protein